MQPSAVVVSGGKQYRVAPGDRILVDRIAGEPGSSVTLGRVLLLAGGEGVKVGNPAVAGVEVEARIIAHDRGPRVEGMRYKPKKRVRVHHGGRAHLTALQIVAVGGVGFETEDKTEEKKEEKTAGKARSKAAPKKAKAEEPVSAEAMLAEEPKADAPRRASRRTKKETD